MYENSEVIHLWYTVKKTIQDYWQFYLFCPKDQGSSCLRPLLSSIRSLPNTVFHWLGGHLYSSWDKRGLEYNARVSSRLRQESHTTRSENNSQKRPFSGYFCKVKRKPVIYKDSRSKKTWFWNVGYQTWPKGRYEFGHNGCKDQGQRRRPLREGDRTKTKVGSYLWRSLWRASDYTHNLLDTGPWINLTPYFICR